MVCELAMCVCGLFVVVVLWWLAYLFVFGPCGRKVPFSRVVVKWA